jgi:tRNA-splicing ligase RtcB
MSKTISNEENKLKVISTEKIPVKLWLDDIEDGAMEQVINLANLPFAFRHAAIMPDSHQGYGMPIGGVLATKGVIIPNAVGVDIGCGMLAIKTSLKHEDIKDHLKDILGEIRETIPVGFNHNKTQSELPEGEYGEVIAREYESAKYQIGSLGGGNHFIEIQKDEEDNVWFMIHSGSRNLGLQVAEHYNKIAIKLNEQWHSVVPKSHELAFLPIDSDEGKEYIKEMNYCVEFALDNRHIMAERVKLAIVKYLPADFNEEINIAHNYARMEHHFGENVMVHRKGATLADEKTIGIIPGSQGTSSYIVHGLGNKESFNSCSHGAGRKMGRKQAERELNLEEEIKKLDDQGILHGIRGVHELDEAPGAYKDIDVVMENQKDLVEIVTKLTPLAVVKG